MARTSGRCAIACVALVLVALPASAQQALYESQLQRPTNVTFHESLLLDRSFKYTDDYFMTELSYRPRYPLRVLARLASTGYSLTVGSVSTSDFLLDQEARIRLPFANWLVGEFDYLQDEDYDERYHHATGEAAVLIPGTGPEGVAKPLQLLTNTPPPWGLFFGGTGELNAFKEFDDAGAFLGYRNKIIGGRIDLVFPAAFYNSKNRSGGKIEGIPVAFLAQLEFAPTGAGPFFSAWIGDQPRVVGKFPDENLRQGALEKARGGFEAVVPVDRNFVFDFDVVGEATGKRRDFDTTPETADRFRRQAGQVWLDTNFYIGDGKKAEGESPTEADRREPSDDALGRPWGARPPAERGGIGPELPSRDAVVPRDVLARTTPANWATTDVLEFGLFAQYLGESTQPRDVRSVPAQTARTLRREAYGYTGYVLTLPSVLEGLAVHPGVYVGYLYSLETERDPTFPRTRDEGVLAKVNAAIEYRFRDMVDAVVNMTFRLDQPQFGGGNVQVIFRF